VDAVWCVEFLEHVGRNFHHNYLPAFRKAALIFATNSRWGGWHHVEVHDDMWWISKFQSYGFVYSPELSQVVKMVARKEATGKITVSGKKANPQHIYATMKVREGSHKIQWNRSWLSYVVLLFTGLHQSRCGCIAGARALVCRARLLRPYHKQVWKTNCEQGMWQTTSQFQRGQRIGNTQIILSNRLDGRNGHGMGKIGQDEYQETGTDGLNCAREVTDFYPTVIIPSA
jgi:hypothetical protein